MQKLATKRAFITGAGQGIGRAIALAFAANGASVACVDCNGDSAASVADEVRATPGGTSTSSVHCCDVSDSDAVAAAVSAAQRELGGLDIVVCNAAVLTPSATVETLAEADWQRAIAVNLSGAFLTCKYALPALRAAGGGNIILMASQMARVGYAGNLAYCASKGALLQLAKTMALDHALEKIRVNTLSPGGTATDRMARRFGSIDAAQSEWGPTHPLNRLAEPEEIANAAVFLASDDASFMTGSDLLVDGGYSAR